MKGWIVASIALAAQAVAPAIAADLPVQPPVYGVAPPPVYSWWTGCYLGGNVGYAGMNASYTHDNGVFAETFQYTPNAFIGGVQVGCNYQWNDIVLGVEGTWSGTGLKQTRTSFRLPNEDRSINIDQIGTVTGRVGYAFDRTMAYVKAGWAGARVKTRALNQLTGVFADFSDFSNGFTVGAGVEHVPWQNIVVGMEFNYYHAGFNHPGQDSVGNVARVVDGKADIFALTVRASYLFGQRVVTNYQP